MVAKITVDGHLYLHYRNKLLEYYYFQMVSGLMKGRSSLHICHTKKDKHAIFRSTVESEYLICANLNTSFFTHVLCNNAMDTL